MSISLAAPPSSSPSAIAVKSSASGGGYDKIEDSVNLQHLMKLMSIFQSADENGSDGLDLEEFQHAFKEILGTSKSDKQLKSMFMKVDTNCDGTVDWDEFCTYMLLEYQEKDSMNNYDGEMPFMNTIRKVSHSPHRDLLSRISFYHHKTARYQDSSTNVCNASPADGRFVSYSKEGAVAFWDTKMSLLKSYHIDTSRLKQLWVLDAIYMQNTGKVITATTDGEINFYELGSPSCERHIRITGLPFNPITIDYWCDTPSGNTGVLIFGDTDGGVGTICFSNLQNSIFGLQTGNKQVCCQKLNWYDLLMCKYDDCVVQYSHQLHREWTRKVQYCANLNCFVSCSTDTNTALILCDVDRRRKTNVFKVNKGVNSFEYSSQWNVIVTGGLDRLLRMWNPYVTTTPTASLRGHESAILHLVINNTDGQIVSLSKDNLIKVWDIQSHGCIQTISCQKGADPALHPPTALCLHDKRHVLLLGAYQLLMLENEEKSPNAYSEAVTHHSPLCTALYNENFNQIVCGCMGSVISVWDVETGEKIIQYSKVHGDREITSMTFDPSGRRLLTGGRDGKVKIWNFNNGACLSEIDMGDTSEITSLLMIGDKIVTAGWNRKFGFSRDNKETKKTIEQFFGVGVHQEDILCSALLPPNIIASGSYKGEIFLWNLDVQKLLKKLYSSIGEEIEDMEESTNISTQPYSLDSNIDVIESQTPRVLSAELDGEPFLNMNKKRRMSKWDGFYTGTASLGYLNADYTYSVENLLFLTARSHTDNDTGSLVSAGARGRIQFWNIPNGELISQFSAFADDNTQETVYGLTSNKDNTVLYTGDSRGYMRAWNIEEYGIRTSKSRKQPVCLFSIRCHLEAIVSIEYMRDKGLLLTASTDRRVRLWTGVGRFIGTFGEKTPWRINPSTNLSTLPKKIPVEIQRCGSTNTIDTMTGPVQTKWRMYKSLMKAKVLWAVSGRRKTDRFHGLLSKLASNNINEEDMIPIEEDLNKLLAKFLQPKLHRPRHKQGVVVRAQDIEISSIYSKLYTPALDESVYQPVQCVVKNKSKYKQSVGMKEDKKQTQNDVKDVFGVVSDLKQQLDLSG